MIELNKIYNEECLYGMKKIPDGSVDMILCDLPYGTTKNKWDNIIPFEPLWEQYKRIIKDNGAIVLISQQPFTSSLVVSNPKMFRYEWIWQKEKGTGFLNAKKMPLKNHENVLVFYKKLPIYNPQFTIGKPRKGWKVKGSASDNYGEYDEHFYTNQTGRRYPVSVQRFVAHQNNGLHPTQKPVALFEYLIKTYSNEGDIVLDNCMGSGTTAIACLNTNRNFIGFELNEEYYNISLKRIAENK